MSRALRVLVLLVTMLAALLPAGLDSTAYADSCGTLGPADVAYGAPRLSGSLDDTTTSRCYDLDLPRGTVLAVAVASTPDTDYVTAQVRSGSSGTTQTCYSANPCRLSGNGPYTLIISRERPAFSPEYEVRLLALTGGTGCPPATVGTLGGDQGLLSGTVPFGEIGCRTVAVDGPVVLNSFPGTITTRPVDWSLFDDSGRPVCSSQSEITLCPASSGKDTLLFIPSWSLSTTIEGQIADLQDTDGCRSLSSSWFIDPLVVATNRVGRLDCRTLSGVAPGDPVTSPITATTTASRLVDANGQDACHVVDIGCILTGPAPYEVLTDTPLVRSETPTYDVAVRKVGPTSDCPVIQPVDYGSVPSDDLPGVGCRQFTAVASHRYAVTVVTSRPYFGLNEDYAQVFASDYSRLRCSPDGPDSTRGQAAVGQCDPTTGDVTILATIPADNGESESADDYTTGLYDLTSDAGCVGPGVGLTGVQSILDLAVTECQLVDVPSGTRVLTAARLRSGYDTDSRYVDDSGALVCTPRVLGPTSFDDGCVLSGPGPYRLLTSAFKVRSLPLSIAGVPTDDLGTCRTVPAGAGGTSATFQAGDPTAKCRRIPATADTAGQVVHDSHVSGNPYTQAHLIGDDGVECAGGPTTWVLPCTDGGSTGATLVLVGTPDSAEKVYRADRSDVPINWQPATVAGRVGTGRTVTADIGDWYNPGGTYTYRWIVARQYVAGATGSTYTIPRSAAGHSLAIEVTAHNGTAKRISRSVSVIVPKS